jgi:hypothetical protein
MALWGPGKPDMQRTCEFFDHIEDVVEAGAPDAAGGSTGRSCIALTVTKEPGNVVVVGLGKSEFCWERTAGLAGGWYVHHQRSARPGLPLRIGGSPS